MGYKEKVAVCSEIHTEHVKAMCSPSRLFEC